ncbi:MAG: Unknown protein [uncultured Sulfurovum sp.]|uniref:Outer membrane protein beta-barrel domain-containing protein n=1 Tax=uncultured Sulfurovum sp. TaxID=269237 RepID=A0A6S6TX28_9BACT|nr:MAG: Unknown protein [uncultured Sulfurovum sp.]
MKKLFLSLIFISSIVMADSFGQLGIGYAKGNNSDNYVTAFGSIKVLSNIGARLEYSKNISEHSSFSKEDISRYGLFATYTLPLVSGLSLTPKVGLVKTDGAFKITDTVKEITDSSTDFTFGLEVNYQLNESISAFVGYTDYGDELDIKDIDTSKLDTANYLFGIKIDL